MPADVIPISPSAPKKARRQFPPGLFRRAGGARFCSAGVSTWDRWTAAGLTPAPVKIGGAVLWPRRAVRVVPPRLPAPV